MTCHCEGAAHGNIVDDYRLNAPCHCEERSDEAISLRNNDQTKNMSFRGENDNLARRGNPGQKCRDKSAGLPRSRRSLAMTCNGKRKAAFTLAETLITLMVIGVVAALTIPALMQNINEYTLGKQRDVFEKKFQEGLRQMRVDDKLSEKYATTEDFVNEMRKYFKISAVCNKDNLTSCFPEKFTYNKNVTYSIVYGQKDEKGNRQSVEDTEAVNLDFVTSDLKTNSAISDVTKVKAKYNSDVMGIIFSDGTQILLTYNPNCVGVESSDTQGNTKKCFGYFADVNSKKSPNLITKDIITNIQLEDLGFEIASLGQVPAGTFGYVDVNGRRDFWLGAKRYCESLTEDGGGWKLPTQEQLAAIAKIIYMDSGACEECKDSGNRAYRCIKNGRASCDRTKLKAIPIWQLVTGGNNSSYIWSSVPKNDYWAYTRNFDVLYGTSSGPEQRSRTETMSRALCVR